ncbi:putative alpha beta hydrolase fold domain-containing protein [Rosellinia necatrix]|uniref:Putative alpha beta hydrolase fold domain-containing protein n=1 Tax=Rosellinia necatrix TaxID=77044 RepID=A0A1S7UMW5_ROSNE|nr:putative alpha beta hydrolase fold domain-containing protein [Rosellinia necatrix]
MKPIATVIVAVAYILSPLQVFAQAVGTIANAPQDGDLHGSNLTYPWPVKLFRFSSQLQDVEIAFMDVDPAVIPNGRVAVCLHGKNFCAPTWEATARTLAELGYRVILIDQIGFCKSTKPKSYQYTLQQLSYNTNSLLHALGITNITLIGHSLGGMTSIRYGLMYPETINELVLVNPIGLEDWKALGVPYRDIETLYAAEVLSNYTTIRAYQQATYYANTWDVSYDVWVNMLANIYAGSEAAAFAFDQALTTDMALSAPVVYEFGALRPRTLLMIGALDNTALGKQWSPPEVQAKLGHYDVLGRQAAAAMPNAHLVEFPGLGHAPQIQDPDSFHVELLDWLSV